MNLLCSHRSVVLDSTRRYAVLTCSLIRLNRLVWQQRSRLVFERCFVRISVGTLVILAFVPPGNCTDTDSVVK
jgi:hypothetical protein